MRMRAARFAGIRLDMGREYFVRAIYEGVAYLVKDNLARLTSLGIRPASLYANGGGAKNPLWLQNQIRRKRPACQTSALSGCGRIGRRHAGRLSHGYVYT